MLTFKHIAPFILLCFQSVTHARPPCDQTFRNLVYFLNVAEADLYLDGFFPIKRFDSGSAARTLDYPDVQQAIYLGGGKYGSVYRVRKVGKANPIEVKVYRDQESRDHEYDAMVLLRNTMSDDAFELVNPRKGETTVTVELDDVEGAPLDEVLKDGSLPLAVRKHVFDLYETRLKQFKQELEKKFIFSNNYDRPNLVSASIHVGETLPIHGFTAYVTDPNTGKVHFIFIKPNNLIVHPKTLRMTLIDRG